MGSMSLLQGRLVFALPEKMKLLRGNLTILSWGQVAAELPLDSEEADRAQEEHTPGNSTLLYIFGHGYF